MTINWHRLAAATVLVPRPKTSTTARFGAHNNASLSHLDAETNLLGALRPGGPSGATVSGTGTVRIFDEGWARLAVAYSTFHDEASFYLAFHMLSLPCPISMDLAPLSTKIWTRRPRRPGANFAVTCTILGLTLHHRRGGPTSLRVLGANLFFARFACNRPRPSPPHSARGHRAGGPITNFPHIYIA